MNSIQHIQSLNFAAFIQLESSVKHGWLSCENNLSPIYFLSFAIHSQHHRNAFILVVYRVGRSDLFPKEKLNQFQQGIVFKLSQNDT